MHIIWLQFVQALNKMCVNGEIEWHDLEAVVTNAMEALLKIFERWLWLCRITDKLCMAVLYSVSN